MAIEAAAARLRPSVCNRPVARRMSSVVAILPNSNRAAGVKARTNPARRSSPRLSESVRRPTLLATVRRASRAATVMASAASRPGTTANQMACRIPSAATKADASNGPTIAPALSPARSTPNARP